MKKILLFLLLLLSLNTFCTDYSDKANWIICEDAEPTEEQIFDVFYIHPTVVVNPEIPFLDRSIPEIAARAAGFAGTQPKLWAKEARVFAPFVRQLEFRRCVGELKKGVPWEETKIKYAVDDAAEAFDYYMKNCNNGRPFILFGHSQGAVDLYTLLKTTPSISARNGLVAAYLIGLPQITYEQFEREFSGRDITPAKGASDTGVVVVWNTESPQSKGSIFSGPGVICINPLNWKTDSTPASKEENLGAVFFDYEKVKSEKVPNFCGTCIDLKRGALIVELPEGNLYLKSSELGQNLYHGSDVMFFAENLRKNALLRVKNTVKK